ncbi:MAG: hypothetical protein ACRD0W_00305 [Acidimicrobiales bacterium]
MAEPKITTETASAVVPPAAKPAESPLVPPGPPVEPPGTGGEPEESLTLDQQQMVERGRRAAQFRTKVKGKPGRPRAPRAGGHVLTKAGWVPDRKATKPAPGQPQVTFRRGEGSTVRNAGGWQVGGKRGRDG